MPQAGEEDDRTVRCRDLALVPKRTSAKACMFSFLRATHAARQFHQSSHAAPTDICARPRSLTVASRSLPTRSRRPPPRQWLRRSHSFAGTLLRKTCDASGPGTSQRCERRTGKAIGCEESWWYVLPLSSPRMRGTSEANRPAGRGIRDPRKHHLPPTRHRVVPRRELQVRP